MIYKIQNETLDLSNLTNIYPASVVEFDGDISEMSLEWTEINEGKVEILRYILVFDFTPPKEETPQGDDKKIKIIINFDTKNELMQEMIKVSKLLS